MYTESKQVFEVITRLKEPSEKLFVINFMAVWQAYQQFDIDKFGLIDGDDNPANILSKMKQNGKLDVLFKTGADDTAI